MGGKNFKWSHLAEAHLTKFYFLQADQVQYFQIKREIFSRIKHMQMQHICFIPNC